MSRALSSGGIDPDITATFDEYHSRVVESLNRYQILEQQNVELKSETETLKKDISIIQRLVAERDQQIEVLAKSVLVISNVISEKVDAVRSGVEMQKKAIQTQYDLDVAISSKRALERDLLLQKAENERLRNTNCQLQRERQHSNSKYFN
mmetsp:Transcript_9555/g.14380  ORF Transcript_9555/g.14380 Transcript_9555/m.14380 type:complete len:150 (+) Transcript_9555:174-623(+)|eukprot:CAMPEP_0185025900 /NCGR_PEP_ID=MMETSP1103-20130426/9448_1 /TAXON_ID=36769 /ORGANISM="Paraphysomonas bandaiensis, Strain Caron Lab Isolate" /LENGTH=149 /DNA_ID=CAMNT_0027559287 /DNA_START=111 /DNA_END=560 /DNA_ORIENTATION=+